MLRRTAGLIIGLLSCGCALAPPRSTDAAWLQSCERSVQALGLAQTSVVADFDGDGEHEIISPGDRRITAWNRIDGAFQPIAVSPEFDPSLALAHPFEFHGRPAVARDNGSLLILSWPGLEPVFNDDTLGLPWRYISGKRALVSRDRAIHSSWALGEPRAPDTRALGDLPSDGHDVHAVNGPNHSLIIVHEASDGSRTLVRLQLRDDMTSGPIVEVQTDRCPRSAQLIAALEIDGDPEPELIGIRGGRVAIVDWRGGKWRWSAPILAGARFVQVVGAHPLDAEPGMDLLLWDPAILLSGCTGRGCEGVAELTALGDTRRGQAFMDEAGVITWITHDGVVSQLRCGG